jgi:hypothetical protein
VVVVGTNFLLRKRIVLGTSFPPAKTTKTKKKQFSSEPFSFECFGDGETCQTKASKFIVT